MFDKFGEFNSYEEINRKAEELKENKDIASLKLLAEENGIDVEEVNDYMNGYSEELTNVIVAAVGKLNVECQEYKIEQVLNDWVEELKAECIDSVEIAKAVRNKGKGLDGFIALLADKGFEKKTTVHKDIVKKCKGEIKKIVGAHEFYIGIPDKATRRELMYQYYLGKKVE